MIHDGYGQAETNVVVANGADAEFKPGSLGLALPGHHVAVVDDGGNELPPGMDGELAVRGRPPTLFAGYWESPEETKSAQRGDWYVTGDIATMDADGFFWFEGRAADMLTSRGERFGPYRTERALRLHDAVAASAVVGVRDLERGGQFLRAFVVLAPGVEGSEGLEAELRQDATQSLPEHEVPREIEFVDELPTAQGGKVRRLELRERLVVGRPLWEIPTTTELEPEFLEALQSQPAVGRRRRRLDGAGRGGSRLADTGGRATRLHRRPGARGASGARAGARSVRRCRARGRSRPGRGGSAELSRRRSRSPRHKRRGARGRARRRAQP